MNDPPPPDDPAPLPYESRIAPNRVPTEKPFLKFFAGVGAGILAVGLGVMLTASANDPAPLLVAAAGEFIGGIVLVIVSRNLRPFGIGLIAAVPIGLLLFFVGCAFVIAINK